MARELTIEVHVDGTQAKRELTNVDTAIAKTTTSADKMGGATTRLQDNLAKLGSVIGVAGLTTLVISLGKSILADADHLQKLADKTGASVEGLQRLRIAGDDAGNTLDQLATAITMMQRRLGGGNEGALDALRRLNINFDDLRKMQPDEQFMLIASRLREVKDPLEQMNLGTELFGRTFSDIKPTIVRGFDDIKDSVVGMSSTAVAALDKLGDRLTALARKAKDFAGEVAGTILVQGMGPGTPFSGADASPGLLLRERVRLRNEEALKHRPNLMFDTSIPDPFAIYDSLGPAVGSIAAPSKAKAAIADVRKELQATGLAFKEYIADAFPLVGLMPDLSDRTREFRNELEGLTREGLLPTSRSFAGFMDLLPGGKSSGAVAAATAKGPGFLGGLFGNVKKMLDPSTILNTAVGGFLSGGISAAIGGIGSLFGKLFSNPEKQVNPVRQAFVDAAGGLALLNQRAHEAGVTLDRVLNAKTPKDYEAAINDLNAALEFQDKAMQTLDATVAKYGITIDQLGPRFKQQQLDQQAGGLIQDYEVLTAAGVEHNLVLEKMAPAMQDYINVILTAGGTIPTQLKGPIEALTQMGLLTDLAGDKLTDVSQLTFAETLDAKFSTLIDTINRLVEAIARTGGAINSIPTDRTVHIGFDIDRMPEITGERMHRGGVVLPFVRAHSGLAIDEVPIIAQRGEGVLNRGAMRRIGGASGLSALNHGGGDSSVLEALRSELRAQRREMKAQAQRLESTIRRMPEYNAIAVRDVVRQAR